MVSYSEQIAIAEDQIIEDYIEQNSDAWEDIDHGIIESIGFQNYIRYRIKEGTSSDIVGFALHGMLL